MNKEAPEYKRVRRLIEMAIWDEFTGEQSSCQLLAVQILSIPGIAILADEQGLPEYKDYYRTTTFTPRYQQARWASWDKGQLQMLEANFKRII